MLIENNGEGPRSPAPAAHTHFQLPTGQNVFEMPKATDTVRMRFFFVFFKTEMRDMPKIYGKCLHPAVLKSNMSFGSHVVGWPLA